MPLLLAHGGSDFAGTYDVFAPALADAGWRDLRPPDDATNFVRLATQASALQHPITVASVNHPDWGEAVVGEPGVLSVSLADALANYAVV